MDKRFHKGNIGDTFVVIDVEPDVYNQLDKNARSKHWLVQITSGGMISPTLANTWVVQIADQLNQFDVANAAVAKLQ